jgi:protein-S-isoprenylcysteine O-methyltransferase Ste14
MEPEDEGKAMSGQDHSGEGPVNAPISPKPPVILLLFLAAGFALEYFVPLVKDNLSTPTESIIVGSVIILCAFAIAALALREMRRSQTTILPGGPAAALVQWGVFKRSRNPIYLSFVLLMLGLGIATVNPWMILLALALLFYLQERVVKREEAYLTARFGPDYLAYRRRVRRWF